MRQHDTTGTAAVSTAEPATTTAATTTSGAEGSLKRVSITFWQGVAMIFGTNIGAGILSLPYGMREGGFTALVIALVLSGFLTTCSMLYVAEVALRTRKPMQLAGLARRYIGQAGSWLVFAGVLVNGYGAMIAYSTGSGEILSNLLGISPTLGSLIFLIPGITVIWFGLHATGRSEQLITTTMLIICLSLVAWTLFGPGIDIANLTYFKPYFIIPIVNLTVFAFLAQYIVPELARGLAEHNPRMLPRAIVTGMVATGTLLALIPLSALGLMGHDGLTPVVTLGWGQQLGPVAYYLANIFAALAMLTSFWALGLTLHTNILDRFNLQESNYRHRAISIAAACLVPFAIGLIGLAGFVSALGYAGAFAGAVMAVVPVLMLTRARRTGDVEPAWQAGWVAHPVIRIAMITVFTGAFIYSLLTIIGLVPNGWT